MEFIDTHCHLSDEAFKDDLQSVLEASQNAGVSMMLQADIDSSERPSMFALCESHPDVLKPMLGLYPGSVNAGWRDEIDAMLPYRNRGIVAVGEIGLDYHFSTEFAAEQREALRTQLELASEWDLPVNIHLRDASEDFVKIIKDSAHLHLRGNLHAFSASKETFREISRYGDWSVGIGGVVTFKNAHIASDLADIPLDRIILETDAPYLSPVPFRGTRNDSTRIPVIAAMVARIKGIGIEQVAEITSTNARRLFSLNAG